MFKRKLIILFSSSVILSGSLYASFFSSITSNATTNNVIKDVMSGGSSMGNINVNDFFTDSKMPFEIDCRPSYDGNFQSLDDICGAYGQIQNQANSILSKLGSGFSLGDCKIKENGSNSCRNESLKKICNVLKKDDSKTIFGVAASQVKSKENMIYTGGDIYLSGNQCTIPGEKELWDKIKYGNKTNRSVQKEYLSASSVSAKKETGGNSALWKPGKLNLYETCIKNALNNGNLNPEQTCQGEFYSLPETKVEAEEQIITASTTTLKDGSSGLSKKISDVERTLKTSTNPNCTQVSNGECVDPSYINNVKTKMDAMVKAEQQDKIKKTEEEMATFQEHVRVATMPKYEITHPTQEVLNGLHPEQKADFVVAANKQMHQKALFNSSIHNLTELKKELIEVSFRKAELSSKTFYPQAAMDEANRIMNSGF
ncbi:hypothetical protein [Aliarcobacter butzleri]|uniref:hypothetical protein n=1 Tax=Aliarcobacter butzleri TaxID=28197 RepID=UPI001269AC7A|nr:hypothetical protein [Aliarcobacter butzleri]